MTEAEAIVHALVEHGCARQHRTLVTSHATLPSSAHRALQTWSTLEGTQALQRRFLDLGIPDSEAHTDTEAVRQGTTLVVVHARADQAERGLAMLPGRAPLTARRGIPRDSTWAMWK